MLTLGNIYATIYAHTQEEEYNQQMVETLMRAEKLESHNPEMLHQIGQVYGLAKEWEQQRKYLDWILAYDRFNVQFYDTSIQLKTQVATFKLEQEHDKASATEWAESAFSDYERYQEMYTEWKDQAVPDRRLLGIQRETHYVVANTYALFERYEEGLQVLKPVATIPEELYVEENERIVAANPFLAWACNC